MASEEDSQGLKQSLQPKLGTNPVASETPISPLTTEELAPPREISDQSPNDTMEAEGESASTGHQNLLSSPIQTTNPASIRASSTPKSPNQVSINDEIAPDVLLPARSRSVRENSIIRDEDLQNELTPLLDSDCSDSYLALEEGLHRQLRASSARRGVLGWFSRTFCSRPWLSWLVLIFIVAILLILLLVARNLPTLLDQAFVSELQSVSIMDISDTGLTVHVVGSAMVDYEGVSNRFYGMTLKVLALFIGGVTVVPNGASRVFVSGEGIKRVHALDVFPPDILVDLIDHRLTQFDFISDVVFTQGTLPGLVQDLKKHNRSESLMLFVEVEFLSDIQTGWMKFSAGSVNIREIVVISPDKLTPPLNVRTLDYDFERDGVALNVTLVADVLPVKMALKTVDWDVAIADCEGIPSFMGIWTSDPFTVVPNEPTLFDVNGGIDRVPKHLLETCEDGQSAFNRFVSRICNDGFLDLFVLATNNEQNARNLPQWLHNILTLTDLNISIPVNTLSGLSVGNYISQFGISSIDLNVFHTDSGELHANTSCDFNASVTLPISRKGFELNLSQLTASMNLKDGGISVGNASTVSSSSLAILSESNNETYVSGRLESWDFNIKEYALLGEFFNNWVNEQKLDIPSIDADIKQVSVELPIFNTTLEGITIRNINLGAEELKSAKDPEPKFIDWFLKEMNVSISKIFLVSSGENWVEFTIETEVFNPLSLSLDLNNEEMVFSFIFEDAEIGNVTFRGLNVPNTSKRIRIPATLKVDCNTFAERNAAEKFVSLVLSGAKNLTVGIKGLSAEASPQFGQMIERIQISDIHLPQLHFQREEEEKERARQAFASGSPFLLEATIHILTSEVELLVFNPVTNQAILVDILLCQAIYEEHVLAYADNVGDMVIPPGIFRTKRIPYKVGSGVGGDILRRALNGELEVVVKSDMMVEVGEFKGQILLQIDGVTAKVRL